MRREFAAVAVQKKMMNPSRRMELWGRNLAFTDQLFVSGANFIAGILMARVFGIHEFGRFVLAWMIVEFTASLQFAAILQPMLNIGPKQPEGDGERYFHAVAAQQVLACLLFGSFTWVGATLAGSIISDPEFAELALPLCASVVAYQLHNFFRRYFFLRESPLRGLANDVLRFSVQLSSTLALPYLWPDATAAAGLWIVAAACAASASLGACGFTTIGWNVACLKQVMARHWEFSKWLLPSAVMFWTTSQVFLILSGLVLSATVTGSLRAAMSITGLLNILLLSLDNFAPAQAARAFHVGGRDGLRRYIVRLGTLTGLLIILVIAVLNIAPDLIVNLLYGEKFEGIGYLVRWFCAPAAIYGIGTVLVVWAAAMEWTRIIFLSYVAATIFTFAAAYPLTRYAGVTGLVLGSLLVECIRVSVLLIGLLRWEISVARRTKHRNESVEQSTQMRASTMEAKRAFVSFALRGIYATDLHKLLAPWTSGQGGILLFHRVCTPRPDDIGLRSLSVTPENFRVVVQTLVQRGYQFLSMTELVARLNDAAAPRTKFVCLTFDDGFADTYLEAFPICREFGVPMTVYLASGFIKREFPMWSFGLEAAITANERIEFPWEGTSLRFTTITTAEKQQAYFAILSRLVTASPEKIRRVCNEVGTRYGIDFMALSDRQALSEGMIREMHDSGLVEFGAHGVHHLYLSHLDDASIRHEMWQSKLDCEAIVGCEVSHFAFPYGDRHSAGPREARLCRELGFKSAVTTECNTLFASDRDRLWSLPRLTYNGNYQDAPLLDLMLSGAVPWFRRVCNPAAGAAFRDFRPGRLLGAASGGPATPPAA
jgi:O-antigen/teichoic acid export membrane protein/peptidoglycan/xylan/chitin deacetylase (PgdA/CDA1 family)